MEQERIIHTSVLDDAADAAPADPAPAQAAQLDAEENELGDNIELF